MREELLPQCAVLPVPEVNFLVHSTSSVSHLPSHMHVL
jgi:hypothetical protein